MIRLIQKYNNNNDIKEIMVNSLQIYKDDMLNERFIRTLLIDADKIPKELNIYKNFKFFSEGHNIYVIAKDVEIYKIEKKKDSKGNDTNHKIVTMSFSELCISNKEEML